VTPMAQLQCVIDAMRRQRQRLRLRLNEAGAVADHSDLLATLFHLVRQPFYASGIAPRPSCWQVARSRTPPPGDPDQLR
jgi:hypothetical protein